MYDVECICQITNWPNYQLTKLPTDQITQFPRVPPPCYPHNICPIPISSARPIRFSGLFLKNLALSNGSESKDAVLAISRKTAFGWKSTCWVLLGFEDSWRS